MLPENLRNLMHRFGFDVTRWPHRPDDGVLGWALDAVLRSREINCVIDVGGNRGALRGAAARPRVPGADRVVRAVAVHAAGRHGGGGQDGRWEARPLGLSAAPGTAELRLHEGPELDSLLATTSRR
jgi:hypothetical protein